MFQEAGKRDRWWLEAAIILVCERLVHALLMLAASKQLYSTVLASLSLLKIVPPYGPDLLHRQASLVENRSLIFFQSGIFLCPLLSFFHLTLKFFLFFLACYHLSGPSLGHQAS